MSISLVALNEHKLLNALMHTKIHKLEKSCNCYWSMTIIITQLLITIWLKIYQLQLKLHQLTVIIITTELQLHL